MNTPEARRYNRGARFRSLHRKLERAINHIEQIEQIDDESIVLAAILERLCRDFENQLGFEGGRIYRHEDTGYLLRCGFGTSRDAPRGLRVPPDYPPHRRLLSDGLVLMARGDPGVDEQFEQTIGVRSTFAAIGVGEGTSHIIAFSLKGEPHDEDVLFSLSLVRHVINLKLQQRRMAGIIDAARILQEGILPRAAPTFGDFDIASAFRPADLVSGDLFDYVTLSDCCLGIAIADSSGHGLPAALLARDVITALRTAAQPRISVPSIVERVNQVIRQAAVSGTFVSLFYGQLFRDGTIEYCNAGHEHPLLLGKSRTRRLDVGGTVLGPVPTAQYDGGTATLEPGEMLVLFTDGIPERRNVAGDAFGLDRIERLASRIVDQPAQRVAASLLAEVDLFAAGEPAQDDMTVLVVRRPPGSWRPHSQSAAFVQQ
jgi:serine phosphatase RsbU (regulator of sigma subunit)